MLTGLERPGLPLDIDRFPSKPVHPQVKELYHFIPRVFCSIDVALFDSSGALYTPNVDFEKM